MKRTALALLVVLATAAGLVGGLLYAWVLDPLDTYESAPGALYFDDKLAYLALVGDLYAYEGDLEQAEARLDLLDVKAEGAALASLIEGYLDGGGQPEDVRNLARLAQDLGASGGVLLVFGSIPTPSATPTQAPTRPIVAQPQVSPTPTTPATPEPAFHLVEQSAICAEPQQPGKILVWVQDAKGNELAGVQIVATWATGQERFYTGLRPEKGPGYADLEMIPQVAYDVTLADFQADVAQGLSSKLTPGICPTDTMTLNWRLVFQQTEQ